MFVKREKREWEGGRGKGNPKSYWVRQEHQKMKKQHQFLSLLFFITHPSNEP